ncbi:MAG TPA: class I SAM-dependent methyltransferase [Candidatus Paceibacterota bacterium]
MSDKPAFDKIYEKPDTAVWTTDEPPRMLRVAIEGQKISPSKVLDVACGEGAFSVYLAKHGFQVTGIDFSENAIEYAKARADKEKLDIRFLVIDATKLDDLHETFDFVFEWALIHHLEESMVKPYIDSVARKLNPGGWYMTNSFNIESPLYGTPGVRVRKTFLGTELHYHSQDEMRDLFSPYFEIVESAIEPIVGKGDVFQIGNFFLMRRK